MKSNLILVKLSTAVVDVKVDKDSFIEEIELDPYDQFGGNSSVEDSNFFIVNFMINVNEPLKVGLDIFVRGSIENKMLTVIINGNEAYQWRTKLKVKL